MPDMFTPERRKQIMRAIKDKDTRPEMIVRALTHAMGYRYRLHHRDLPGRPDLVFSSRRKVIFVHGCFWHGHTACKNGRLPKSNVGYWSNKIQRNCDRDRRAERKLRSWGWGVMTIWECQVNDSQVLGRRITRFLNRV